MSAPTIIAGPAIVQFNSNTYYSEGDIVINFKRETFNVVSSAFGTIDTRLTAQMAEITFKPVGALDTVAKYIAYAATAVGSLVIDQATPKTVVVWGADGKKMTWGSGFISKLPAFTLSATKTAIESMTLTVFANPTKSLTAADAWNAATSAALSDTTFDETKILTGAYLATWGSVAGFVAVPSEDGFTFEPVIGLSMKKVDSFGYVNALITDITYACRFKPVGTTEAQLWAAMNLQDTGALVPGASLATASDLVVSAGAVSFTLAKAGIASSVTQYGLEPLRLGEVAFVNKKTFTTGAMNAPITVAFTA